MGGLGWPPDIFWRANILEVTVAVRGYHDHNEMQYRTSWETARFVAYNTIAAFNGTKKLGSMTKFCPFPWDDVYRHKKVSPEQLRSGQRMAKKWASIPVGTNLQPLNVAEFMIREKITNGQ